MNLPDRNDDVYNTFDDMPDTYIPALETGILHNNILHNYINSSEDISNEPEATTEMEEMENAIIDSDEFNDLLSQIQTNTHNAINELESLDIDYFFDYPDDCKVSPLLEEVLRIFLEIYTIYPDNIEDINFIIKYYLHKIIESQELDEDSKIVAAKTLSVAMYSPLFWEEYLSE